MSLVRAAIQAQAPPPWTALVPALAFPVLFLHLKYQPKVLIDLGSTTLGIELSDVAVLAVVAAGATAGFRYGWTPLRPARLLWVCEGAFLALVVVATLHPLLWQEHYRFLTHAVTAAKFCEYGLLAPAVALLLRGVRDVLPLLAAAVAWSVAATGWALLQFAGVVSELEGRRPLQREPSFVGIHDLAALSGAVLALALAVLAFGTRSRWERALVWIAGPAGALGLILSAAVAGVIGVGLAAAVTLVLARARRLASGARTVAVVAIVCAVAGGVFLMRSGDVAQFIRSLGVGSQPQPRRESDSYVQRSLLAYISLRMFADHPVIGVGWLGSQELENYEPYLADAHRRFPDANEEAFPAPDHPWGAQNAYLQTLTDLGLAGFVVLAALFVTGTALGVRAALRAPPNALTASLAGILWLLVAAGVWIGVGLVAGIPLDALTWIGVGLIGAATAWTHGQ